MRKQYVIAATVLTVSGIGIGLASTSLAGAEASATNTTTRQAVTKHPKMIGRVRENARLNQAVTDGTITANQRTPVKAELQKLRAERKSSIKKSSTTAEKQAENAKLKTEFQSWASTNSFPIAKVFPKLAS